MEYQDYVKQGLDGKAPLKLILCGSVEEENNGKVGVVSVCYATNNRKKAEEKLKELTMKNPSNYYMVYSVPLDTDLMSLEHYPSIEITMDDLGGF